MKNKLYKKKGDPKYVACTRVNSRLTKEHVIERLSYSSTLTDADIHAVLAGFEKELVELIALGHSIDLGFLSLGFSVKGRFDSPNEGFRKGRNWVSVNAKVKKSFTNAVNKAAKPKKVISYDATPRPLTFKKIFGNKAIPEPQPGNLARIFGSNLAFDVEDTDLGVYLQMESKDAVRVTEYAKSGKNAILLKLPDHIEPGIYKVEVRVRTRYGKIMKGYLQNSINVA
jgi:hypothetical protein